MFLLLRIVIIFNRTAKNTPVKKKFFISSARFRKFLHYIDRTSNKNENKNEEIQTLHNGNADDGYPTLNGKLHIR